MADPVTKPLFALLLLAAASAVQAESAQVAVATNFAPTAEALARDYAAASGNEVTIIGGATGKLYAQIVAGAPFDAFLSADGATPARLAAEGHAILQSAFTYATGRLVLWSATAGQDLSDPSAALAQARHVAIANPELAPYGKAAVQALAELGFSADLEGRLVIGENIGQAYAMTATGAADLGFIAASALVGSAEGSAWPVPQTLHDPIRQDAVLLMRGRDNAAAIGFLEYLAQPEARAVIAKAGYGTGP